MPERDAFKYTNIQNLSNGFSLKRQFALKAQNMAEQNLTEKRNVTPEMAVRILKKQGVEIDEKKASEVLDLMYFIAKLIVNQNFKT